MRQGSPSARPARTRLSRSIVARAAAWVSRLSDDAELTEGEREQLRRWLRADPRHAAELQMQTAIHELARAVPGDVRTQWLASVRAYERRRSRRAPWIWATAAVALAFVALLVLTSFANRDSVAVPTLYATRTAEIRTIRFADGSTAVLNTRTRLQWVPATGERRVVVLDGEALFQVAHDARHPFRVIVDGATIEDAGTQFNVLRKPGGQVRLTVLQGAVKVAVRGSDGSQPAWQRLVKAHQQIDYRGTQILEDVGRATDEELQWRQGTVRFRERPLSEVVEELQRYTDQRIVIADPDLAEIPVGGVYSTRNVGSDLARIARSVPMLVQERNGIIALTHLQTKPGYDR